MTSSRFHIDDLGYEHSVVGLRHQLQRCPGIQDVMTDPREGTATVTYDPRRWNQLDIEHLIAECGYVCHCGAHDQHAPSP
jgi:copper chaperone CopZ